MLYPLFRSLLFQLPPEQAHDLTLRVLRRLASSETLTAALQRMTRSETHSPLERGGSLRLAGLHFPNRVGIAGGLDKNGVAVRAWYALGFGFVELGTVTPKPQAGNDPPRMWRVPSQHAVTNRMGFNNAGAAAMAAQLATVKVPFPIGISIGVNKRSSDVTIDDAASDYTDAVSILAPFADFLTMNVSSPNTPGLRALQEPTAIRRLVRTIRDLSAKPLFVKLAPDVTGDLLAAIVDACLSEGAAGLIGTNTLGTISPTGLPAGLSGRPLRETALRRVGELRRLTGDGPAIIGVGGIDSVPSARAMIAAGADLIQIYTGLVYEGPWLAGRLARGLRKY